MEVLSGFHDRSRQLQIEEHRTSKAAERAAGTSASKALAQALAAQQVQEVRISLCSNIEIGLLHEFQRRHATCTSPVESEGLSNK